MATKAAERAPTKFQIGVLKDMATGAKLHFMSGLHAYYFLGNPAERNRGVKWESAVAIIRNGWATEVSKNKFQPYWAISEKGKKALAAAIRSMKGAG